MIFAIVKGLSLPIENPVLIFSLILFIILFAPIILNYFKIPHLIGLIIAGAIVGPNSLNLLERDGSVVLFGTVGLLYIMFLAGLEMDIADFKKNSRKSILFGMFTFSIPMALGVLAGFYLLHFSMMTSVLLASMFASHTLVVYPVISQFGITRNRAVGVTIGGTMITDTLALLVLAVIVGMTKGELTNGFWIELSISVILFILGIIYLTPIIARWFFKRFSDKISQYIFVLGIVFISAFAAELAGLEAIIGAFLAGITLNRLVPQTSPLMNRIEFVGNALFIPFFLMGVGMLIDFRILFTDIETIFVAIIMTVVATVSKYLAALLTQKTLHYSADERRIIFGLSNAQAAATLAAVLVGYNIIIGKDENGEVIRLLNDSVLNGTIVMILVTCTIASFVAQKGAQNIARETATLNPEAKDRTDQEKMLIAISHPDTIEELVNLAVTMKTESNKGELYGLNIISEESYSPIEERKAAKLLKKAVVTASSTDNKLRKLLRYDLNVVNGIANVVKEQKISDIFLGLHHKSSVADSLLGSLTEGLLSKCHANIFINRFVQPLSTIKRHLVVIPTDAEKEAGFPYWIMRIWKLAKNTGEKLVFFGNESTLTVIKEVQKKHPITASFNTFPEFEDFLTLTEIIGSDDGLVVIMSRKNAISYQNAMSRIPKYLTKYFNNNNFIMVYPRQQRFQEVCLNDFGNPNSQDFMTENIQRFNSLIDNISKLLKK